LINPGKIENKPVETDAKLDVPRLQHNLDRVLFNPGVHVVRDSRSRVYNFDPEIAKIMPADEFDYSALGEYITSSKDEKLRELCVKYNKKYCGSTSSLSAILSHFHYLISAWRKPNFKQLSGSITPDSTNFTQILRSPAAAFAHHRNGSYAIDADKEHDVENILSSLGKSMEKHFLLPKEDFEKYRRTRSHEISEEQRNAGETYHYSELGDFLVRSQLDAYDPRLPGTGVFDIKTRAVISIRMDVVGYEKGLGYEISQLRGQWHSFEREYMDMIRAAFLKYSLQVRMGRMDGIFCAYHNTQRIFGFQYIPLSEMDVALHGTDDTKLGDDEFKASITMLNALLDRGAKRWPGRTLRLHVETRDTVIPLMYFFVEPVSEEFMERLQTANKSSVAASAAKVVAKLKGLQESLGESTQEETGAEELSKEAANDVAEDAPDSGPEADEVWDELMSKVEDVVENDTNGLEAVRAAIISALDRQSLMEGKTQSEVETYVDTLMKSLVGSRPEDSSAAAESELEESEVEHTDLEESQQPEREVQRSNGTDTEAATPTSDQSYASMDTEIAGILREDGSYGSPERSSGVEPTTESDSSTIPENSTVVEDVELPPETSGMSLQELVLRAAENADSKSGELRAFERVFAELLAEAKAKDSDKDPSSVDDEEPAAPEDQPQKPAPVSPEAEAPEESSKKNGEKRELLGMVVTVKNKVDGKYQDRPEGHYDRWTIGYSVTELEEEKARKVYSQLKKRRSAHLTIDRARRDSDWYSMFKGDLKRATDEGREMRQRLEKEDNERQTFHVAWDQAPRPIKSD
jgi:hypothetical protein